MKKISLKDAGDLLYEFHLKKDELIEQEFKNIQKVLPVDQSPIVIYHYTKDGKHKKHLYCPVCKNEWEEERYYRYDDAICKECNNSNNTYYDRTYRISQKNTIPVEINKQKGYIVFMTYSLYYKQKTEESIINETFDFMKKDFELSEISSAKFSIFITDKGMRFPDDKVLLNITSKYFNREYNSFFTTNFIIKDKKEILDFFDKTEETDLKKMIINIESDIKEKRKQTRNTTYKPKVNPLTEFYINYKPNDYSVEHFLNNEYQNQFMLKSNLGESLYIFFCGKCKKIEIRPFNNRNKCSYCGNIQDSCIDANNSYYNFKIFESVEEQKALLIRYFEFGISLNFDETVDYSLHETNRVFLNKDKIEIYHVDSNKKISKLHACHLDNGDSYFKEIQFIQTKEEIKNIILKTDLKYSGLIEAWGLSENTELAINNIGEYSRSSYIYNWYKKPYIEQLLKVGLTNLTKELIDYNYLDIDIKSSSVYEILKINKTIFKIFRKLNERSITLNQLKSVWKVDNHITLETFNKLKETNSFNELLNIAQNFNISIPEILEYIDSCYNNQCIQNKEAAIIWRDYLRMAKQMKMRLDNRNTKFPPSLKKEHDRAIFAYKVVTEQINREKFNEKVNENLKYEYNDNDFIVIIPKTPEEIISEGTSQKHCVASYVEQVRNGTTTIAFLRNKKTPEDSYFTMEITNDEIRQIKGYTNCPPTDEKLLEFIEKYSKNKKLTLNY